MVYIGQDQRLLLPYLRSAHTMTLHAGMVYQPCGRQLLKMLADIVRGNIHAAARADILPMGAAYNRILEETARAADFMPVGQLPVAYTPDFFGGLAQCGRMAKFLLKFAQRAIFKIRGLVPGNHPEAYAQHDVPVLAFVLEEGVAVSEAAFRVGEPARFARQRVEAFHGINHILGLDAVRPHILHGRGSHASGYAGHVLHAP